MREFDLIKEYFTWDNASQSFPAHIIKSVGDDAAILEIEPSQQLVTSVDTFISGVHFPENTPAEAIGHKALAVNLSDLAAMGATPRWFTLALTLPEIDQQWLAQFSHGLKSLANQYNCFLVGGDTTRGALSITIQVMGVVDRGRALLRSGAKAGDAIYVTGTLGDAAIGLQSLKTDLNLSQESQQFCLQRLNTPTPRLIQSEAILPYASSCIDISDGLLQDLGHILKASQCGAQINLGKIPLSAALNELPNQTAINAALTGGDDYELLFTIPQKKQDAFNSNILKNKNVNAFSLINELSISNNKMASLLKKGGGGGYYKKIGQITRQANLILDENCNELSSSGFNHF